MQAKSVDNLIRHCADQIRRITTQARVFAGIAVINIVHIPLSVRFLPGTYSWVASVFEIIVWSLLSWVSYAHVNIARGCYRQLVFERAKARNSANGDSVNMVEARKIVRGDA